jgi:hypothetical protein
LKSRNGAGRSELRHKEAEYYSLSTYLYALVKSLGWDLLRAVACRQRLPSAFSEIRHSELDCQDLSILTL